MLQAIGIDGITPIWLWSEGTGTELDPYKSNFYAYQGGSWSVSVDNFPSPTGLTNAELREDPIPVSGTVTVNQGGTWNIGSITTIPTVILASESGYLTYRNTALSNIAVTVKATAGSVMGWNFLNSNTVPVYVKFYNIASGSVTVGTSAVALTILVPPSDGVTPGMFFLEPSLVPVEVFSTAISIACVTGLTDNSTTAPTTPIHVSVRYK